MVRISKIVCDKCSHEDEFKDRYSEGWGLLEVVRAGKTVSHELCPKCTKEASPKP